MENHQKLQHFSHKHPLILVVQEESNSSEHDNLRCYACTDKIYSGVPYYGCKEDCPLFCLHQSCADMPMIITKRHSKDCSSNHLQLTQYLRGVQTQLCDYCYRPWFRFSYVCSHCHFKMDIRCAQRYSAITDLTVLSKEDKKLHEDLDELAQRRRRNQLLRPFVHNHRVFLVEKALDDTSTYIAKDCSGCGENISFGVPYYRCHSCNTYGLHKLCARLPRNINKHEMHPTCTLILQKLEFSTRQEARCSVCRAECGYAYCCLKCKFVLDIVCALKAITFSKSFHQHPLIQSLTKPSLRCHACDRDSEGVSYQCSTCRFCVHQQCASSPTVKLRSSHEHKHDLTLVYSIPDNFSETDVYCQLCGKYMKYHNWAYHCSRCRYFTHVHDCSDPQRDGSELNTEAAAGAILLPLPDDLLRENEVTNVANINHCRHPMILFEDQFESKAIDVSLSFLNLLRGSLTWPTFHVDGKDYSGSTFSFLNGRMVMRITSVDLPRYIKHEAHPHVLMSTFLNTFTWCNACEHPFFGCGFRCTHCAFTMDTYCALLPRTIKHKYDEHRFLLTYAAIEDVEEYVCEICEEDVIPLWFYHCEDCDQSIHARCIWKAHFKFPHSFDVHLLSQPAILVPPSKDLPECVICHKQDTFGHGLAFISEKKDFMVHLTCTYEDEVEVVIQNDEKTLLK